MVKRIIASLLGTIAVLTSVLPLGYAYEAFKDYKNPSVPFWTTVFGGVLMSSMALAGLWIGIDFLRFGSTGRGHQSNGWMKPVLLGIGCFFPGFVFSLPLTVLWAIHVWPDDGQNVFAAMEVSVGVGIAVAIICTILLLRRHRIGHAC